MAEKADIIRRCSALAMDAMTFGLMRKAADREQLELRLSITFPNDWREIIDTIDRFDRASVGKPLPYIMQMWAAGVCGLEETMALMDLCPAAFRNISLGEVVGMPATEVLPRLASNLP